MQLIPRMPLGAGWSGIVTVQLLESRGEGEKESVSALVVVGRMYAEWGSSPPRSTLYQGRIETAVSPPWRSGGGVLTDALALTSSCNPRPSLPSPRPSAPSIHPSVRRASSRVLPPRVWSALPASLQEPTGSGSRDFKENVPNKPHPHGTVFLFFFSKGKKRRKCMHFTSISFWRIGFPITMDSFNIPAKFSFFFFKHFLSFCCSC